MRIEIICEECIREMAQSKEYSENDFLYSGYTSVANDIYCNKTDVRWDDLIQEKCNTFSNGTPITIRINGKDYKVTTNSSVNTIKEIAREFTKQNPYNFSYNSSGNYLIIDAAKITFNAPLTKSARHFLGYNQDSVSRKLPYTLPNKIKITANADAASLYVFDSSYNIKLNADKSVDIRADGANNKPYYKDDSLVSGLSKSIYKPPYVNNLQLVRHLNKRMIGYGVNPNQTSNDIGNCFYKFAYDYSKSTLIVSDLVLYSKDTTGKVISDTKYTYTITKPSESSNKKAMTMDDVVLDTGVFRKFDYTSDTTTTDTEITYNKNKVNYPTVTKSGTATAITGVYTNGLFVCVLNDINTPTFQIAFDTIGGDPIIMCSGSKYVKIDDTYYTLPYTQKISNGTNGGESDACKEIKRNKSLCDNKKSAQTIIDKTQKHPGFDQQYIDAKGFSDMSVLNIINLGIGIVAATYFIAKTYK
jgi:hypothetical protein